MSVQGQGFQLFCINNYGRRFADGEYLLLLNNDVEVIDGDWLADCRMLPPPGGGSRRNALLPRQSHPGAPACHHRTGGLCRPQP